MAMQVYLGRVTYAVDKRAFLYMITSIFDMKKKIVRR